MKPPVRDDGLLLVDKPVGPTSHDVVARVRRALGTRRVGHTGTLDPFASGLLLVCVNRATRLVEYLHGFAKEYVAVAELGRVTDTLDPEGEVTATHDGWQSLDSGAIRTGLDELGGRPTQLPPVFSAKKVAGEAAHRRIRRGEEVRLEPVPVTIHALELLRWTPPLLEFRAVVSTGTYIRAMARDLGEILGVGAHLRRLRRTGIGPFQVTEAVALDALDALDGPTPRAGTWLSALDAVGHLPQLQLTATEVQAILAGRSLPSPGDAPFSTGAAVALSTEGRLLAVAEARGDSLQPRKVFPLE
ncbi:MAG: tRNA pseudouridine(55) synthase TruB [Gemmatimonadales bacterium]|nr:MAG: tRNA pseudouridine(55) synthase TruB [Gemmatimonadales bacterium]